MTVPAQILGTELPLLRFIPFRRRDIVDMCLAEERLAGSRLGDFRRAAARIDNYFQRDFHSLKQQLKDAYAPIDPDADTRCVEGLREADNYDLAESLSNVLNRANYEKVAAEELEAAFESESLFSIRLYVNLDDFEHVLLYTRGANERVEQVPRFLGLFPKTVRFKNYDRVVLYIKFKDTIDESSALGGCRPGSTMLKLFQDVPDADLEMLFPNTRVGMRFRDKLLIGIPAMVSGAIVLSTKVGATLVLLASLLGFWLGMSEQEVTLDRNAVLALLAGFGALGAYFWKQFSSFRNRKLRFTETLTRNLYFKLLDNNAGVLYRVLDDAEESECKESLLAYYFLLAAQSPLAAETLDSAIEDWFATRWQCQLDFEIDDALRKLELLGLAAADEAGLWSPVVGD